MSSMQSAFQRGYARGARSPKQEAAADARQAKARTKRKIVREKREDDAEKFNRKLLLEKEKTKREEIKLFRSRA